MTITVDDPDATAAFIGDNRAILFQLALSSMKLEIPTITEILRAAISRAIKGKATDAIRAYFCIAETQEVVFSEEDEEGFELVASVIDRERTHRLPHSADRDSLVTACYFCKLVRRRMLVLCQGPSLFTAMPFLCPPPPNAAPFFVCSFLAVTTQNVSRC